MRKAFNRRMKSQTGMHRKIRWRLGDNKKIEALQNFTVKKTAYSQFFESNYSCDTQETHKTQITSQTSLELRKGETIMASNNSNKINVPEARAAMDKFKMEAASEVGVNLKNGYNGDLTSREAGSVGGQMVKKMIESYEKNL